MNFYSEDKIYPGIFQSAAKLINCNKWEIEESGRKPWEKTIKMYGITQEQAKIIEQMALACVPAMYSVRIKAIKE